MVHESDSPSPMNQAAGAPDDRGHAPGEDSADGAPLDPELEADLWHGHPHWKDYIDLLGVAACWTVIGAVLGIMTRGWIGWTCLALITLAWFYAGIRTALGMLNHHYRLTTQRLFVSRGILSKTIDQTEIIRIDDVRITKSLLNRLCGLGSIEVMSTDPSDRQTILQGVPAPDHVADLIRNQMRILRRKSLFVERL